MRKASGFLVLFLTSLPSDTVAQGRPLCTEGQRCTPDSLYFCFESTESTASIVPGQEIEMSVRSDVVSDGIEGWCYGVRHDPDRLEITEATTGADLPPVVFASTFLVESEDPSPGFVSTVVFAVSPEAFFLPTGNGKVLARAKYRALNRIQAGISASVEFADDFAKHCDMSFTIGQVRNYPDVVFDAELGTRKFPFCSNVAGPEPIFFARGDADGDARIDLTDAIAVVQNIFFGKLEHFDCDDRLDVNDDGLLDTSDAIVVLVWLFLGGEDPPVPFQECGTDLSEDGLGCAQSNCVAL